MRLKFEGCEGSLESGGGVGFFLITEMKWNIGGTDEVSDDSRSDSIDEVNQKL